MIEFVLFFTIFMFIFVGVVDYYGSFVQYDHLKGIKNYYQDQIKLDGQLTASNYQKLEKDLETTGFELKEVTVMNANDSVIGYDSSQAVVRNTLDPSTSALKIKIVAKPMQTPFFAGRLLGKEYNEEFVMITGGRTVSELPKRKD